MSRRPGLLSMIWNQLTKKTEKYQEKVVGRDFYGNLFFESNEPNFRGQPKRFHQPATEVLNKISPEWDAWLRYRRKEPPTEEEVMRNVKISELKKTNATAKARPKPTKGAFNEFNTSYPKHSNVETNPGQSKQ